MRKLSLVCFVIALLLPGHIVQAQDPPLSPEQLNLLAQIDAADLDQSNWQSYTTVSFNTQFLSESLTTVAGSTLTTQRTTNATATTTYDGNPLNPDYNSDTLLTIENREQKQIGSGQRTDETYILTVNARYFDGRLYVLALRDGGSADLPAMPPLEWLDVTEDPDQLAALKTANLRRYLPDPPPILAPHPVLDVDLIALTRGTALRDLIADIELVSDNESISDGEHAGLTARQIRIRLNPLAVLQQAFAGFEQADSLVAAFANETVDMSLNVWLNAETGRRLREQYVFVMQGSPEPTAFGYTPDEVSNLSIIYQFESDISYIEINEPVEIPEPEDL